MLASDIRGWLDRAAEANVVVIGEPIIDRYIHVRPLGKSAKESIVTFTPIGTTDYRGGGWIVAAHAGAFAKSVCYRDTHLTPVLKQRYVEHPFRQTLFSIVENIQIPESPGVFPPCDILLIADYGHGLLGAEAVYKISHQSFLALTVQSNSANWGFNLLTKWPRADYVVVDEVELRLACADRYSDIESLARRQAERMGTEMFAVTLGHEGCLVINGAKRVWVPAVADRVVDRMGAGDAFLAVTALLVWAGAPAEVVGLVGNIAGGIKVGKMGNKVVTREEVEQWLKTDLSSSPVEPATLAPRWCQR